MTGKRFDQNLFNNNDRIARLTMALHAKALGLYVVENEDKYGPDLIVGKRGSDEKSKQYAEVEIKQVWRDSTKPFPFDSIQLPSRKAKFLGLKYPTFFYILSRDLKMAYCIDPSQLKKEYLKEVRNVYVERGEMFYQIPLEKCKLIKLEGQNEDPASGAGTVEQRSVP